MHIVAIRLLHSDKHGDPTWWPNMCGHGQHSSLIGWRPMSDFVQQVCKHPAVCSVVSLNDVAASTWAGCLPAMQSSAILGTTWLDQCGRLAACQLSNQARIWGRGHVLQLGRGVTGCFITQHSPDFGLCRDQIISPLLMWNCVLLWRLII